MLKIQRIQDGNSPALRPFLSLRQPSEHKKKGIFVCQGEKNVSRLLNSRFEVLSMISTEEWVEKLRPLWEKRSEVIPTYVGPKALLKELIGFKMYHYVMAAGKVPAPPALETVLMTCPRPYFFAALDALTNADNMGAVIRNCGAFGAQALIVDGASCSPFMRRSVRSSMGAIFELPVVEVADLTRALKLLKKRGIRRFATSPDSSRKPINQANFEEDCCIILGSEGHGISNEVMEECDERVAIPIAGGTDSLNVASAAGIFFYEVAKQRGFKFQV